MIILEEGQDLIRIPQGIGNTDNSQATDDELKAKYQEGYTNGYTDGQNAGFEAGKASVPLKSIEVHQNGVYRAENGGYNEITVNFEPNNTHLVMLLTENGEYNVPKPTDYDGFDDAKITVNVDKGYSEAEYNKLLLEKQYAEQKRDEYKDKLDSCYAIKITENGNFIPDRKEMGYAFSEVTVDVPMPKSQEKNIAIEENGNYEITPDEEYCGISKLQLTINVQGKHTEEEYQELLSEKAQIESALAEKIKELEEVTQALIDKTKEYDNLLSEVNTVREININENGTFNAQSNLGYNKININVDKGLFPEGTFDVTENGKFDVGGYKYVNIQVPTTEVIECTEDEYNAMSEHPCNTIYLIK